jgi:hypothetical protein
MIRVDVEEYCNSCLDFSPDVTRAVRMFSDNTHVTQTDTIIQCEYRKRCANIKRYLEQQTREEISG